MYWFGSVGCVGSWFCNSLTNKVRKSFAVMSDEPLAELLALLELLLDAPLVDDVESFAVACAAARRGASAAATDPAADVPDVAIELSCDKSIAKSPLSFSSKLHSACPAQALMLSQLPPPTYAASGNATLSSVAFKLS